MMTAKERHKETLLGFLSDPGNPFPHRNVYSTLCMVASIYSVFSSRELTQIEDDACDNRRANSARGRALAKDKLLEVGLKTGNVSALTAYLDRVEGKVAEHVNLGGTLNTSGKLSLEAGPGVQQLLLTLAGIRTSGRQITDAPGSDQD